MSAIVVNLFGVPGSGKSIGAAYIYSHLKMNGINAELVTEYAKDKVWEENSTIFKSENQIYVFAKQFYRLSCCVDKVDVIVNDSPILLSNVFLGNSDKLGSNFKPMVRDVFNKFDNFNIFVTRVKPYEPTGRNQKTAEEADVYRTPIINELAQAQAPYIYTNGDEEGFNYIVNEVIIKLSERNKV